MQVKFKFADGRDREIDEKSTSELPLKIGMTETIERKFSLSREDGKPVYAEIGCGAGGDEGPIGGTMAAVLRFLESEAAACGDDADGEYAGGAIRQAAEKLARGEHWRQASRIVIPVKA